MNGLLVIDKPGGMTSRDALNRVQRWFPRGTKIGHTGTLDPLATGVLVGCVGAATKLAELIQGMDKGYTTRIRLGATSTTDDADGAVVETAGAGPPSEDRVREELARFVGVGEQVPPAYSALKINGRRAYELARAGAPVIPAARPVRITAVRLVRYEWPFADAEIECGKGTYVRSIARDLGAALGVGGLVETLRRTRVGPFLADAGVSLETPPDEGRAKLLPMTAATAGLTPIVLDRDTARRFWRGDVVSAPPPERSEPHPWVAVSDDAGTLVGIGVQAPGSGFRVRPLFMLVA